MIEEDQHSRRASPVDRVENMFEQMMAKMSDAPSFILCVLPEKKNSNIYGLNFLFLLMQSFIQILVIRALCCLLDFSLEKEPRRSVHVTLALLTLHVWPHFILLIGLFFFLK